MSSVEVPLEDRGEEAPRFEPDGIHKRPGKAVATPKPPPCDIKATPMRPQSYPHATPKPPPCDLKATPMRPQSHPHATTRLPQSLKTDCGLRTTDHQRSQNAECKMPHFPLASPLQPPIFGLAWAPCVRMSIKAEKEKLTKNLTSNLRCHRNDWTVRQWSFGKPCADQDSR